MYFGSGLPDPAGTSHDAQDGIHRLLSNFSMLSYHSLAEIRASPIPSAQCIPVSYSTTHLCLPRATVTRMTDMKVASIRFWVCKLEQFFILLHKKNGTSKVMGNSAQGTSSGAHTCLLHFWSRVSKLSTHNVDGNALIASKERGSTTALLTQSVDTNLNTIISHIGKFHSYRSHRPATIPSSPTPNIITRIPVELLPHFRASARICAGYEGTVYPLSVPLWLFAGGLGKRSSKM